MSRSTPDFKSRIWPNQGITPNYDHCAYEDTCTDTHAHTYVYLYVYIAEIRPFASLMVAEG